MFIYEGNKDGKEVLNIVFEGTQIPVKNPDVQLWKDGDTVHVKIGNKDFTGTVVK